MDISGIYKCIFDALHARSVEQLVETASHLLEMPIVVTDATFVVLAKYPLEVYGDDQWDANTLSHQIRPQYIKVFQQDDHWSAFHTREGKPVLVNWGYFEKSPRYSAQILSNGKVIGYVAALIRDAEPIEWHLQAMEILADGLSVLMELQRRSKHGADIMAGVMLQGLLLNEFESKEEIARLCDITGDTIEPNYVLAAIKTKNPQFSPLEEYLGSAFTQYHSNVLRVVQDDCLYVLYTGINRDFKEKSNFKEAVHQLKVAEAVCAFSRVFSELLPITDYKWQADRLLEVGTQLRPDKTIFHFDDYELYASLTSVAKEVTAENMVHPLLHRLARYDDDHNTDYLETLKVYVLSYFNKGKATEELHVHRNTLSYRLEKIEEIAHASLTEGDLGCSIYLSFKYMELSNIDLRKKTKTTKR